MEPYTLDASHVNTPNSGLYSALQRITATTDTRVMVTRGVTGQERNVGHFGVRECQDVVCTSGRLFRFEENVQQLVN